MPHETHKRAPSVRLRLITLVLLSMVPTVAAAVLAILYVYQQERDGFERGLTEATRALSLVVDREIARREAVLKTLAESPTLTARDLSAFYGYASQVSPTNDTTIVLTGLDGEQLLNTRRPLGTKLPSSIFKPLRKNSPHGTLISDLYFAPLGQQYSFAVEVPVIRAGEVIYYVAMGNFATHMQQVLADQKLPQGWIGTILDRQGVVVARSSNAGKFVNQKPQPDVLLQMEAAQGRVTRIASLDGVPVVGSFNRSRAYGWAFFIGVPESQITSPARVTALFAIVAALLLVASLLAALRLGRKLVDPILQLSSAAEALGKGQPFELSSTGIAETDRVGEALSNASAAVRASRQAMEQRVVDALEEAEKAHRAVIQNQRLEAIGQLTGGVAHDFNNLLMVVGTNVHLLRHKHPELKDEAQLGRIDKAVATGSKLTRQLLAFARRQPLRPEVLDLAVALPELMELIRPTLTSSVTVSCEVAADTPPVKVDPAELELAIINLVVNSKDAMPQGGSLAIRARAASSTEAPEGKRMALIEVSDTGQGIPAEIREKVFEPFFTTKEVGRGTGLGLSQVYGMSVQAGGLARLRSAAGEGTTVTILLPAALSLPGAQEQPDQPVAGRMNVDVLLVEDNVELALAGRELLAQAGCRVTHAASGDQALALLPTMRPLPQVVLSDIRMPGKTDGIALAGELKRRYPGLPVILITGYTTELEAARAAGLLVLAKPAEPQQMLDAISAAVGPAGAA